MKLHSPAFEKVLRKKVRAAIRRSPELKREYKRHRKTAATWGATFFSRGFASFFLIALLMKADDRHLSLGTQLALVSLWLTALTCMHVGRIRECLYSSNDLATLNYLPVERGLVFQWEWQKSEQHSRWGLLACSLTSFSMLAALHGLTGWAWLLVIALAVCQWRLAVSCAALLNWSHFFLPVPLLGLLLGGFILGGSLAFQILPVPVQTWVDAYANYVNVMTPAGWVCLLFRQLLPGGDVIIWVLLVPVLVLLFQFKSAREKVFEGYQFTEMVRDSPPDVILNELEKSPEIDAKGEVDQPALTMFSPRRAGTTEIVDGIRAGSMFEKINWADSGRIEAAVVRWFTAREEAIVASMTPNAPQWTRHWWLAARCLLAGGSVAWLTMVKFPTVSAVMLIGSIAAVGLLLLPHGNDLRRAFMPYRLNGLNVPFHAGFPLSYRELSRLLFKIATVRCVAALPLTTIFGLAVGWVAAGSPWLGAAYGFKLPLLALAMQPLAVAGSFSQGTNDTSSRKLVALAIVGVLVLVAIFLLVFGVGGLLCPYPGIDIAALAVAGGIAYAFFRFYGWLYHRNYFDLIKMLAG